MRGARCMLCLGLIGLFACTRGGSGYYGTTEPKHGPDEIWTNLGAEPEYIDPGKSSDHTGGTVITNLFAGLLQPHPVSLEPMPELATHWKVSGDGRSYTFHLRPSTWSDGTPLTAADFVYSWRRVLDPKTASKYASFLYPLRYGEMFNARAVLVRGVGEASEAELRKLIEPAAIEQLRLAPELDGAFVVLGGDDAARPNLREQLIAQLNGKAWNGRTLRAALTDATLVGVRAPDPATLVVDLEAPVPYFLNLVCFSVTLPVPKHVLDKLEAQGLNTDLWTRAEHIVSNGPYVLADWQFRQRMVFEKNPKYWDAEHVRTRRIKALMVDSSNTVLNLYEAGELDTIGNNSALPSEFVDTLRATGDFSSAPVNTVYFYWINVKVPPLDDARVRNALRFSIDREAIVKHVTRGGQVPTSDLVPSGLGGYQGIGSPIFDPERARKLLAEAGYGPNKPLPKITVTYNTSEGHKQIAEAVQAQWKLHLGIEVEIENQEWNVYLRNLKQFNFQIARMGWVGDYPDAFTYLELLTKASGNNHSQWSDPRYEEVLRRANQTTDKAERLALFKQAEAIAMEAAPLLPFYIYTRSELTKPYLRGSVINFENKHLFKYWWIDRRWYSGRQENALDHGFPPRPKLLAAAEPGEAH
ncbi:MAG TPA: peptide ABC transporter substrate-binding protein [Polyangiales bacterium]|nr:peptide ABC transporter substrate-binding protein [Polyangiales bacterium]